ncbi:OsmC family protein [Deinococcus sp. Arct2-2]|uniref:OsmC family protein n=1 Tax=Deinococcus sp. Arct2-2 TaxID=2568653 RepID=UPI0010A42F3C|nr:OsmC family protein [Deinococcus sp. Arct2-2]THF68359.1 OsmC family protein [Deinococcus sp. Arct2-2]
MHIQVSVHQTGPSTSLGQARTHRVVIDRPLDKEGSDQGMMGGEHLLVALGGCFMSNLLAAIQARNANIQSVRLQVTGTLASAPSRFSDIEVAVNAQTEDLDVLEKLVVMSDRACIVSNTLRPAVNLVFRVETQPTVEVL